MKTLRVFVPIVLVALGVITSCGTRKSNRQLFEEQLEKNVEVCSRPFIAKGVDPAVAQRFCRCSMEYFYRKDSTFVKMTPEQFRDFQMRYADSIELRCAGEINYLSSQSK